MNRFESSPVVNAFREAINRVSDPARNHFICGVSGGIDSMTLLYMLYRSNIRTTVVHCNYGLRGESSDKDSELVEEVSAMWRFDCVTARFDPSEAEEQNTQAWARHKRYQVFRDIKREADADFILTAHHQSDQIETILQKLFRGAGMSAWNGMELRDGDLVRPLLNVRREQIVKFAREQHVPYREDETNRTEEYARNFIRHTLAAEMDHFFPGWRKNVLKISRRADEFSLMAEVLLDHIRDGRRLSRSGLLKVPPQVRPVLVHRFLLQELPNQTVSEGVLNQFLEPEHLQTGAEADLGNGWKIVRNREYFQLISDQNEENDDEFVFTRTDLEQEQRAGPLRLQLMSWRGRVDSGCLQADSETFTWPVTIRRWKEGDRIQSLGMKGSKSVADIMTDKKISTTQKSSAFLAESFDGIIIAVIFPHDTDDGQVGIISEQVKCSQKTNQVLQIEKDL